MTLRPTNNRRPSISANNTNNDENYSTSEKVSSNTQVSHSESNVSTDQSLRYQELKRKQQIIQKDRTKREVEYEHAKKQLKECLEEASALGVSTIEELEDLIKNKEKEEKDVLDRFEESLIREEKALKEIEENLNN